MIFQQLIKIIDNYFNIQLQFYYMYLLKVKEEVKTELNLIREGLSKRQGEEVSFNYVIEELLRVYKETSKLYRY